jgi:hypothetical protein
LYLLLVRLFIAAETLAANCGIALSSELGRYLLIGKLRDLSALASVLDGNPAYIAVSVEVKDRVFVEISGFCDVDCAKLDV